MTTPAIAAAAALEQRALLNVAYARARAAIVAHARQDANAFARFVLRDEKTGKNVPSIEMHAEWHRLLDEQDRVVIWSHLEGGKTNQLSIARPLWVLGKNPNRRIVIVSNTAGQVKKIVRAIGQYIESSKDLKAVFPDLRRADNRNVPWNTEQLTVQRSSLSKDPSVQGTGIHGAILGARIDDLILDDILDWENTRTKHLRDELYAWLRSTLLGRVTEQGRVWALGNAYHPEDALHMLAAEPRFHGYKFPVCDPETGRTNCPELWSDKRIAAQRLDLGPLEFARQMLCMPRDDSTARFKREWIEVGTRKGEGFSLVQSVDVLPPGYAVFHGVDLAVAQTAAADLTVIFTILLHPDGTRQVLNVFSGKISGPDIVRAIDDADRRYGGTFLVENVAAQHYIVQFAQKLTRAEVRPFGTGRNKADPSFGVESMAAEMAAGRWIIPNRNGKLSPEIDAWVGEMLYYDPQSHTGDRLMASWFAREAARRFERRRAADLDAQMTPEAQQGADAGGVLIIGGGARR